MTMQKVCVYIEEKRFLYRNVDKKDNFIHLEFTVSVNLYNVETSQVQITSFLHSLSEVAKKSFFSGPATKREWEWQISSNSTASLPGQ